jgi:hypothetical protein
MSNPELPGSYDLRFRLAGWEALAPPFGLLSAAFGIFAPDPRYLRVLFIALGGFLTVPYVIMLAGRTTGRPRRPGRHHARPEVLMRPTAPSSSHEMVPPETPGRFTAPYHNEQVTVFLEAAKVQEQRDARARGRTGQPSPAH